VSSYGSLVSVLSLMPMSMSSKSSGGGGDEDVECKDENGVSCDMDRLLITSRRPKVKEGAVDQAQGGSGLRVQCCFPGKVWARCRHRTVNVALCHPSVCLVILACGPVDAC